MRMLKLTLFDKAAELRLNVQHIAGYHPFRGNPKLSMIHADGEKFIVIESMEELTHLLEQNRGQR